MPLIGQNQVGIPFDREQYIHRLGRTGRQGKHGEGILLLAPWEEYFLYAIKDLPLEKLALPEIDQEIILKVIFCALAPTYWPAVKQGGLWFNRDGNLNEPFVHVMFFDYGKFVALKF